MMLKYTLTFVADLYKLMVQLTIYPLPDSFILLANLTNLNDSDFQNRG